MTGEETASNTEKYKKVNDTKYEGPKLGKGKHASKLELIHKLEAKNANSKKINKSLAPPVKDPNEKLMSKSNSGNQIENPPSPQWPVTPAVEPSSKRKSGTLPKKPKKQKSAVTPDPDAENEEAWQVVMVDKLKFSITYLLLTDPEWGLFDDYNNKSELKKRAVELTIKNIPERYRNRGEEFVDSVTLFLNNTKLNRIPSDLRSDFRLRVKTQFEKDELLKHVFVGTPKKTEEQKKARFSEKFAKENPDKPFGPVEPRSELVKLLCKTVENGEPWQKFAHRDLNLNKMELDDNVSGDLKSGHLQGPFISAAFEEIVFGTPTSLGRNMKVAATPALIAAVYMVVFSIFEGIIFGKGLFTPYKLVWNLLTKAKESDSPNWRAFQKHFNSLIKANPGN
ncbi:hypothetical protein HK098_008037 [Nowakowskiella sp. JEL0407]|nr:hypothetical protein HK098_008037 [Nowakowskiella sp. JEL0407]